MNTQSESLSAPKDIRTMRDDTTNNPHPRATPDMRLREVFVTHSRSTR